MLKVYDLQQKPYIVYLLLNDGMLEYIHIFAVS